MWLLLGALHPWLACAKTLDGVVVRPPAKGAEYVCSCLGSSAGVAVAAGGDEVVDAVVVADGVEVIDLDRAGSASGKPVERHSAPVARVRAGADGVIQDHAVLVDLAVPAGQGMRGDFLEPVATTVAHGDVDLGSGQIRAAVAIPAVVVLRAQFGAAGSRGVLTPISTEHVRSTMTTPLARG
jgi:hypothetical protein